jgi:hypothetical protein
MADFKARKAWREGEDGYEDYARVHWLSDMFRRHEDYWWPEMQRLLVNQRMFWGINFGQWPAYAVEKLRTQGRRPPTFNIIGKKIESMIGQYLENGYDISYEPVSGHYDTMSLKVTDMVASDSSNLDWEFSEIVALRDMFNMLGIERMKISDKYDPYGNIAWEPLNPTHVYLDTGWRSYDPDDIRHYFEWAMLTPSEIAEIIPQADGKLKEARAREERSGTDLGDYNKGPGIHYRSTDTKWGDRHMLIVFHRVKVIDRWWEYDEKNKCPFPETGYKLGSEEDVEVKRQYAIAAGLTPDDISPVKQKHKEKWIEAICPSLLSNGILMSGKDRIQTQNCNIYPVGNSYNGQYKGLTDDLYDIQIGYNKGKMNIEDIQQRAAHGAFILDRAITGGDATKEAEIESRWNDPAARLWADEGTTADLGPHGGIIALPTSQPTPDLYRSTEENLSLADWFSTPAAMDSRTESSQESGKLLQTKIKVGLIGQKYGMSLLERHKKAKARAYPRQAKITYAGKRRAFKQRGGGEPVEINRKMVDAYGQEFIENDIRLLPEMAVNLTQSQKGINVRTELRQQYAESIQILQTDPNNRLGVLIAQERIFETYVEPDDKREEMEKALHVLKTNAALEQMIQFYKLRSEIQATIKQEQDLMAQMSGAMVTPEMSQEEKPQQQITSRVPQEQEALEGTPQQPGGMQ